MDVTPLTSVEIDKILRADLYCKSGFLGVFPRDKIPLIKFYPACFVLNTDPSYKIGEHWLGIYFDNNRKCFFFDSFGNPPEYFNLDRYLSRFSMEIEYNYDQIQGFFSNTCGHYTIFFILLFSRGLSLKDVVSCFNFKKFDLNDFTISFINE